MFVEVLTPDKKLFEGAVKSIDLPGSAGAFKVLTNHAPLISSLTIGNVHIIKEDGETQDFTIKSGFVEVLNNNVAVLIDEMG